MNKITTQFPLTQEQISHYKDDGYVIVWNFFSAEELEPLKQACDQDPELYDSQTKVQYGDTGFFKISVWSELGDSLLG